MNSKYIPIFAAIGLPILLMVVLMIVISFNKSKINPGHNFLYTYRENTIYSPERKEGISQSGYVVENEKLVATKIRKQNNSYPQQEKKSDSNDTGKNEVEYLDPYDLYLYDMKNDTSKQISFEDASKLILTENEVSPDGYTIERYYSNMGIFELFGSGDNTGYYIKNNSGGKKLSAIDGDDYTRDFTLIAWVK